MTQAASHSHSANQTDEHSFSVMIGAGADPSALAAYLDGQDAETRIREVRSLSGAMQKLLFERCEKAPPLTLEDMVPSSLSVGKTMIFAGRNSMPMFKLFEKRFTRTQSGAIVGFNFQSMSVFTGPGYFTVVPAQNELLIDYTKVPGADEVPADWPKVQPNNRGLSHFVYKNLHDYCRRVSRDVVIGHATRLGQSMPQYFVLARRPV